MDTDAIAWIESTSLKTLHAQSFSRSSSQAAHVLSSLLSQYMTLLASTCKRYSEHAGRNTISIKDVVLALDEVGVSVEELSEYCEGEGREMSRYAQNTARRTEELSFLKGRLSSRHCLLFVLIL